MKRLAVVAIVSTLYLATVHLGAQSTAPSNLVAIVNGTTVTLNWQAPSGTVDGYVIDVGSASGLTNILSAPTGSNATTITFSGVPFGTYFVRVRAFAQATGFSGPSNEVVVNVGPCTLPTPAGVTAIVIGNAVALSWSAVSGAVTYQIEAGSAPSAADLVNVDVGATQSLQVAAPAGTYFVRLRAKAPTCGTSAASPDTVVRVQTRAGIGFDTVVGAHGAPFTSYTEGAFTVEAIAASWTINRNLGRPAPFVQFRRDGDTTVTGQLRVGRGGEAFRFTSVELYSSVTTIPFVITGMLNSMPVFSMTGTVPNPFGTFATVSAPTPHILIDTLIISVDNPATPGCPTCAGNPVGVDNIAVPF